MRINLGTKVMTADGKDVGKIDRLVVDPRSERMQEFVVRKGFFTEHDIIIPIGEVEDRAGNDDDDTIHLRMTAEQVKQLPDFVEHSYVAAPSGMYPGLFGDSVGMGGATGGGLLWPAPIYMPAAQGSLGRAGLPAEAPLWGGRRWQRGRAGHDGRSVTRVAALAMSSSRRARTSKRALATRSAPSINWSSILTGAR